MTDDEPLDRLVRRWEELQRTGEGATLEELCGGNPETLTAVRQRLDAVASMMAFLGLTQSPGGPSVTGDPHATTPPDRPAAGGDESAAEGPEGPEGPRFRVLRPHARGGLGAVFVALDAELRREVALKQILENRADDALSRTRFVLEAEITGGLEHPGVVPVYGLGADAVGRPYYAMRFVRGDTLEDAIQRFHLDHPAPGRGARPQPGAGSRDLALRRLLRRFLDVCNTVDYAHSRGVVHRDIKPRNVIVGRYGETLVVDWGLAKVMGEVEPGSAGPEGALQPSSGGSAETLPGQVLGTPAYMSPEQAAGDVDAQGPRTDVYSLGSTLYCILTGRAPFSGEVKSVLARIKAGDFPTPRSLQPGVERGLEAVCLKAMALKPDDRYTTARALADDVERFLADEPVSARPDPLTARAWRWVRKHRTLTTTAAAVALVALAGLAVALRREATFNDQLRDANTHLGVLNRDLNRANDGLVAANRRADRWLGRAMTAIDDYYSGVSEEVLLSRPELSDLRERLLDRPKAFYEGLSAEIESGAEGASGGRERLLLASSRLALGRIEALLGHRDEALKQADAAVALYRKLAAEQPDEPALAARLGTALSIRGVEQALRRNRREAERDQTDAIAVLEPWWQRRQDVPDLGYALARALSNLGNEQGALQRPADAARSFARSIATFRGVLAARPTEPKLRHGLATVLNNLGLNLSNQGRYAEAAAVLRDALPLRDALAREFPRSSEYADGQAMTRVNLGLALTEGGNPAEAVDVYREAARVWARLAEAEPRVPDHRYRLALTYTNLGKTYRLLRRTDESIATYHEAIQLREALTRQFPDAVIYRDGLARSYANYAVALQQAGRDADALEPLRRAVEIRTALLENYPGRPEFVPGLADALNNQGLSLQGLGRTDEALAAYRRGIELLAPVVPRAGGLVGPRNSLSNLYYDMAIALRAARRPDEAAATTRLRLALWPGNARETYDAARELMRCLPLVEGEAAREALAREVVATLAAAEAAGYDDPGGVDGDDLFAPLRTRDDFRVVAAAVWRRLDRAFPADPFAPPGPRR